MVLFPQNRLFICVVENGKTIQFKFLSKMSIVTIFYVHFIRPDSNPNDTFWNYNSVFDDWKELSSLQIPRSELG